MRVCVLALLLAAGAGAARRGDSHSYPHSTGYSGTGTGGAHTYPHSTGLSGNTDDYNHRKHYQQNNAQYNYNHKSEVHHHYHYSPPQQINYGSAHHTVYQGPPPVYVYEYRDSGSRFDNLLTGLALYNLGRMSAGHHDHDFHREYSGTPGEICKLGISKQNGEYEETRIDCKLMSSFIWEASSSQNTHHAVSSSSVTTTQINVTQSGNSSTTGNITSVTTVTVKNDTVLDALKAKGPSITVTPGMTCFMIRISKDSSILKKNVECGLLQEYARRSFRPNSSERLKPVLTILINFIIYYCLHILC